MNFSINQCILVMVLQQIGGYQFDILLLSIYLIIMLSQVFVAYLI